MNTFSCDLICSKWDSLCIEIIYLWYRFFQNSPRSNHFKSSSVADYVEVTRQYNQCCRSDQGKCSKLSFLKFGDG